jgi:DnaJ-class molecular chaperone
VAAEADAFATLGVSPNATDEEVRLAWRKLMRDNHPDGLAARGVPAEFVDRATRKVAEINAAYEALGNEEARRVYDRFGEEGLKQHQAQNAQGGGGGGGGPGGPMGGIFQQ